MYEFPKWIDDLRVVFGAAMAKREEAERLYKRSPTEKNRLALAEAWDADTKARRAWTVPFDAYMQSNSEQERRARGVL